MFREIYHETTLNNYLGVKESGRIFKSSRTRRIPGVEAGKGGAGRALARDPFALRDFEKTGATGAFPFDEVDGVYARPYFGRCDLSVTLKAPSVVMFFGIDAMRENRFVMNTTENNGFALGDEGAEGVGAYSGARGVSITSLGNLGLAAPYLPARDAEIVFLDDLPLDHLTSVVFFGDA